MSVSAKVEQLEVDHDQYMVEWELEKKAHAETKSQLADITFELDRLLVNFSNQYEEALVAHREKRPLVREGGCSPKEQMNWNGWFLHELKTAIRHAGYKKRERHG